MRSSRSGETSSSTRFGGREPVGHEEHEGEEGDEEEEELAFVEFVGADALLQASRRTRTSS